MSKNEIELEKLRLDARRTAQRYELIKSAIHMGAGLFFAWMFFECLKSLSSANPDVLHALGELIKNMSFDRIMLSLLAGGASFAWGLERHGKKRLVKELADARNERERNDAYTASSGLTPTGDTPMR